MKPYVHQEFPKMVYDHSAAKPSEIIKNGKHEEHVPAEHAQKVVNNQEELDAALEEGFSVKPPNFNKQPKADKPKAEKEKSDKPKADKEKAEK